MSVQVETAPKSPISRRRSSLEPPLSPTALPDLAVLPKPYAADKVLVGQLVSPSSKHDSAALEDRDYDDLGLRWYKDVILIDSNTGRFKHSLGGVLYVPELEKETDVGTIEAREMRCRMLKNPEEALQKVLQDEATMKWVKEHAKDGDLGFVTAVREVVNASYKHASVVDRGAGNWEVVREVGTEKGSGKRRDSGLDVETGSKRDVVGVVVRNVLVEGDKVTLGSDELGTEYWN
jgi:hypothetical protein